MFKYKIILMLLICVKSTQLFSQDIIKYLDTIRVLRADSIEKKELIQNLSAQLAYQKYKYKADIDNLQQKIKQMKLNHKQVVQRLQAQIYLLKGDSIWFVGVTTQKIKKLEDRIEELERHLKDKENLVKSLRVDLFEESFQIVGITRKKEQHLRLNENNTTRAKGRKLQKLRVRFSEGRKSYAPRYRYELTHEGSTIPIKKGILPNENEKGVVKYDIWKRKGKGKNKIKLKKGMYTLQLSYGEGEQNKIKITRKFKMR